VNGQPVTWKQREDVAGHPVIELTHAAAARYEVKLPVERRAARAAGD